MRNKGSECEGDDQPMAGGELWCSPSAKAEAKAASMVAARLAGGLAATVAVLTACPAWVSGSEHSCGAPGQSVGSTVESRSALSTVVEEYSVGGIAGHTTYRVAAKLLSDAANIYTIFGDSRPMLIPAALQQDTPFGVNLGGSNPQFFPVMPDCEFDSWLTVGPTDGNNNGDISAIGIDFDGWDETHQLSIDNGAIFWMDPDNGPAKCPLPCPAGTTFDAVLAQLTLPTGTGSPMHFDAQGNSAQTKRDWEEHCIEVMVGGPNSGAGSHSASGLPMPPDAGLSMAPAKGSSAGAAAVSADCPYTADGSCDEGTGKGKCPAGTDTADCLGAECLSVDTDMINASCAGKGGMASGSVPDTCTPACAVVYMAWWQRCSPAQELQAADQQMNGGLSEFYSKCVSARGGGH